MLAPSAPAPAAPAWAPPRTVRRRHRRAAAGSLLILLTLALALQLARPARVAARGPVAPDASTPGSAAPATVLREALAPLGADLVTTGRLLDRTVPLAGLRALDGRPLAPVTSPARFRQVLDELARAAVTPAAWPAGWPAAADLRARAAAAPAGRVELAMVHLAHQTLRPDVLARGLLTATPPSPGGPDPGTTPAGPPRLGPAPGATTADLLTTGHVTAAAAVPARLHRGAHAEVVLPSGLLLTDAPVTVQVDLDDGRGLRRLVPDRPLAVRYDRPGRRTLRLRVTDAGGRVHHARTVLEVAALSTPSPDTTWALDASIPFEGAAASGEAFVLLGAGHEAVTDPVVVVEGFDLDDSLDWPELYALLNQQGLLEDLRAAGHDAVVLNFATATAPIQRNAFLLVELLQTLDAGLPAGVAYPVVGASMGGLVARYALAWLEAQGAGHRCELLLTFDTPHTGAVIPVGLQHWVDFFASESAEAAFLRDRLATPAARQMLLQHHTAQDGVIAAPDPRRAALAADLDALGQWPAQPRLVAVANGSALGTDQGFAAGDQLVEYEYGSFLVDIVGNVWAVADGGEQVVFDGLIDLLWPLPDSERTVRVAGSAPWDGAPGGWRASLAQVDTASVPYGDIVALHPAHAFIPTVSALAREPGADPFADLADLLGAGGALPPFDAVYLPAANQEHVAITAETAAWLQDEIRGLPTAAPGGGLADGGLADGGAAALQLHGAAPNPFNPRTTIGFTVPRAGEVRVWIADARGRRVREVLHERRPAGSHAVRWDGRDDAGRSVASGVYLAVVEHGGSRVARRLTVMR